MITDNVLIAYEMTHYINQRRQGRKGVAAIKLDMSKAYDRVEWAFLKEMMVRLLQIGVYQPRHAVCDNSDLPD